MSDSLTLQQNNKHMYTISELLLKMCMLKKSRWKINVVCPATNFKNCTEIIANLNIFPLISLSDIVNISMNWLFILKIIGSTWCQTSCNITNKSNNVSFEGLDLAGMLVALKTVVILYLLPNLISHSRGGRMKQESRSNFN
jgi:hypothetical protein